MKCVCPMGGDRTCPDDCILAVWAALPMEDRKAQRKTIAERLYRKGFTQEAIAMQLGVSQRQISTDLAGLEATSKPPRPKGGRPKGKRPKPQKLPGVRQDQRSINAIPEDWERFKTIAEAEGKSAAAKLGELIAEPEVKRSVLSMSAQQKFDAAVAQEKHRLAAAFGEQVRDEVRRRIDEIVIPEWKEKIEQAQQIYARRRGLMDKETFNTIRRALHPDSRNSISDKKLGEAFDQFMGLEKHLLNEKDSPTGFTYPDGTEIPDNLAEWDRRKAAASSQRRAKQARGNAVRPRP